MIEMIILIIFNKLFPVNGSKLSIEETFFLDEIENENNDFKDRDSDAPITNEDFNDGPDW